MIFLYIAVLIYFFLPHLRFFFSDFLFLAVVELEFDAALSDDFLLALFVVKSVCGFVLFVSSVCDVTESDSSVSSGSDIHWKYETKNSMWGQRVCKQLKHSGIRHFVLGISHLVMSRGHFQLIKISLCYHRICDDMSQNLKYHRIGMSRKQFGIWQNLCYLVTTKARKLWYMFHVHLKILSILNNSFCLIFSGK